MRGIIVAVFAGWLAVTGQALAQEPRYDAATETCRPYPKPVIDRQWQLSGPRNPLSIGQGFTVGLREKYADTGYRLVVRARIVGGATRLDSEPVTLVDDNFANREFPRDFQPVQKLEAGTYTVIWVVDERGGFLACDGFVIR
jgi:hypothetical protein